jgi:hypothetical protein
MSEKGPFDTAIAVLNSWADCQSLREKLAPSIRVLEAAGKVDKEALTTYGSASVLDDILVEMTLPLPADRQRFVARYTRGERDFMALLKALPDKEEK